MKKQDKEEKINNKENTDTTMNQEENIGQNDSENMTSSENTDSEMKEKYLRLYSEFDNYKKRTHKEKLELIFTASERVITDVLPIVDDFERAIIANEKVEDITVLKDGFLLIYNKLHQLLKKNSVTEIGAKGEVFDTDIHEAIAHIPVTEESEKGKVVDVTQKGYKINDKIIRYAKVVVGD
ncbi:MAG: nucleotide exchange factor GrpE [Bacteroidales bacterium]|jgi:molecular chaperone GrpE|nr:nucleotide exchange factor GrpE [Bacteroidales bacterium]